MAMVAQTPRSRTISPELVMMASSLVKLAHPADISLHRALDKASTRVVFTPWRIEDGKLEIASHTNPTETHQCDDTWCTCPTKQPRVWCWHRAAWLILSAIAATGVQVVSMLPLPDMARVDEWAGMHVIILKPEAGSPAARIQALVDELF